MSKEVTVRRLILERLGGGLILTRNASPRQIQWALDNMDDLEPKEREGMKQLIRHLNSGGTVEPKESEEDSV